MSRRKDRERFLAMKRLDPNYPGFRGYDKEPTKPGRVPLQSVTCTICGRKRNVPLGIALAEGERYVCLSCREEQGDQPSS
jgi:hypothetical protein